jgi:hypothetical protein
MPRTKRPQLAVVHGEGEEQLASAWNAINAAADVDNRLPAAPARR